MALVNQIVNRKGPLIDPGLCRCCGLSKKCRIINVEYDWFGQKEVYSDMFFDCYGLLLSQLDGEPQERLICATCVTRLREATAFKKQVLGCEQKLLEKIMHVDSGEGDENDVKIDTKVKVEVEEIQNDRNLVQDNEYCDTADDYGDHLENDADSVKEEKAEIKKKKKKKEIKVKKRNKKKSKMKSIKKEESHITKRKLRQLLDDQLYYGDPQPKTQRTKDENDLKSFQNAVTIIENSYVCPFDTSFSDYFCVYCRQDFTDPEKLREHTMSHEPGTYKDIVTNKKLLQVDVFRIDCRLCPVEVNSLDFLKEHLVNAHEKVFNDVRNEFLQFKLTLTNLTCMECGAKFSFFHGLKKHMAEHFGTCICDVCGAHYFEERNLIHHKRTHQKIEENFPCHCGKVFKSKRSQYIHEATIHKKEPAYPCSKCDEMLFSYSLRYRHMLEVHGEKRLYPCEHCDRAYDSRKSLREHNRRLHLKNFKHQCDLCEKRFYLPSRLKEHMAMHTGERNYRCDYCGKSYPRLRSLKVHLSSHSEEKKYRCLMCNASFTQNVNLKNHMKRQHQSLELEGFQE